LTEDQLTNVAPPALAQALHGFLDGDWSHFATPGHKRSSRFAHLIPDPSGDAPLLCGVDDQRLSLGLLDTAQREAARVWGADWTLFSVHGSTHPNQAVAMGLFSPGSRVVVSRASHKSVIMGLVLAGVDPVWVYPEISADSGLALGVPPDDVRRAIDATCAVGVWLVEPSYVGCVSDLVEMAHICRTRNVPLVVDQAWGAHFGFHPSLPANALAMGADIAVMSTHKTLTALAQGAMLHGRESPKVDGERLRVAFEGLRTTSPSAGILASLDSARYLMETDGCAILERTLLLAADARTKLESLDGVRCLTSAVKAEQSVHSWDETKVVVDLRATGVDGLQLDHYLRANQVQLELADRTHLIPLVTVGDSERSIERLASVVSEGITRLAGEVGGADRGSPVWRTRPEVVCSPRDAFYGKRKIVSAERAAGRVCAETIAIYPPGIPLLAPGERVTADILLELRSELAAGSRVTGPADSTLQTLTVLA
jgi:arginine decarboxylase